MRPWLSHALISLRAQREKEPGVTDRFKECHMMYMLMTGLDKLPLTHPTNETVRGLNT